ncbi:SpoIIE family protein phosphatase [Vibrio mangrovi]|uniref:SpoIIE family protein phosphatase n=1 Tax=Vibrio mangrovi TaxID=474394 RepID=A0A1Y6IXZ9_9VIBR|nr:SpoIIE family protein phosphatase [Vibrio mangrovi]MDW6001935.1 SpoIIE family protein phosphatase [Vibrio mangrovi]SMS02518.1 Stage II sporulation protein E (SpoIIE) [Vibrio mangrovi]
MPFEWYSRCVPCFGESESGDGLSVRESASGLMVAIIDVLGHGPAAARLAREMERYLDVQQTNDLPQLLERMHHHFLGSLGAAVTLVYFDYQSECFEGVGVGNTLARKCGEEWTSYAAQPGIVGEMIPTLKLFRGSFRPGERFLFTTDGVKENLDPRQCRFAQYRSLPYFVSFLIEHFGKSHDDTTVIALEYNSLEYKALECKNE